MRRGNLWAVLAIFALNGCGPSKPIRDMVGYVPPTSVPAQPKRTMVQDQPGKVWDTIIAFLQQSNFDVDHIDNSKKLIVARYSGNPEPYVDCGSIVTHENGALGQISGSAKDVSLNYKHDNQPVILRRALNLDSRIIIRLEEQRLGTVVSTDTTYVVTKTVDIEKLSGNTSEGSRETVSFSAGKRAEFSKGTACQPNGSLDVAILQSLPNVIGSNEITRADLPIDLPKDGIAIDQYAGDPSKRSSSDRWDRTAPLTTEKFPDEHLDAAIVPQSPPKTKAEEEDRDWTFIDPDLQEQEPIGANKFASSADEAQSVALGVSNATNEPAISAQQSETEKSSTTVAALTLPDKADDVGSDGDAPGSIADEMTSTLLASLDCQGDEWHFCDIIELAAPYRKRNLANSSGLTINIADRSTSQIAGSDLKLDVDLPNFPSYLHLLYVHRNGRIDKIVASPSLWPPDVTHSFRETGYLIPGPSGLAMIVALVSEQPLMLSDQIEKQDAKIYLRQLEQRLTEIGASAGENQVVASQLLINVE